MERGGGKKRKKKEDGTREIRWGGGSDETEGRTCKQAPFENWIDRGEILFIPFAIHFLSIVIGNAGDTFPTASPPLSFPSPLAMVDNESCKIKYISSFFPRSVGGDGKDGIEQIQDRVCAG